MPVNLARGRTATRLAPVLTVLVISLAKFRAFTGKALDSRRPEFTLSAIRTSEEAIPKQMKSDENNTDRQNNKGHDHKKENIVTIHGR